MTSSITKQLENVFENAALNHVAKKLLKSNEWKQYDAITKQFDKRRKLERKDFRDQYHVRLRRTEKYLIDKAASKKRDFKHRWFGQDNFSRASIKTQADKLIRQQHRATLLALDEQEREQKDSLLARCDKRNLLRDKLKQDFARATDRRQGVERRQTHAPTRSR